MTNRIHKETKILIKHMTSGTVGSVFHLSLFIFFVSTFGKDHILLFSSATFLIGLSISFLFQKFWTYGCYDWVNIHNQFFVYAGVGFGNLFVNFTVMSILTIQNGMWHVSAQIISAIIVGVISFVVSRFYIFRHRCL